MRSGGVQRACPLLCAFLEPNPPKLCMTARSSSTEGTVENSNIELGARRHFSDGRLCKSQQVGSYEAAQNYEKTRLQTVNLSGGIHSTPCQRQVSCPSHSVQPFTHNGLPVGDNTNLTDDQIQERIEQMVACFSTENNNMGTVSTPQSRLQDSIMPKSSGVAHHSATYATNRDSFERQRLSYSVTEQSTTSLGQAFEEDCSKGSKSSAGLTQKSREMDDCATPASKKHSTEIMGKVAATCTKNEDESPVVLTTVPGMTLDEWTEKQPSSSLNKNLAVRHMPEREKGYAGLKPEEAIGVTDAENPDANAKKEKSIEYEHFNATSIDMIAHSEKNLAIDEIQISEVVSVPITASEWLRNPSSHEGARKDLASVHSQTVVSTAHPDTKVKEQASLSVSECKEALLMNVVKDPQYEDISDDEDISQLATELTPCYEDISEDENSQIEDLALEGPSLVQEPETNNKQLPFQSFQVISDERLIPNKHVSPETETLDVAERCSALDHKSVRHLGGQTNHSVSHSPSSLLKDEYESDDHMDDECVVIPISVSDIRFEPEDEDQDSPEKDASHDASLSPVSRSSSTSPIPASASSQEVEVFDTYDSFCREKAVPLQNTFQVTSGCSTPEHELDYEGEPNTLQSRRELYSDSEDSCETEDSCDYSSGSGHNIMTGSKEYLKMRSASLCSEKDNSVTEKVVEKDQIRDLCERLRPIIAAHSASKQNKLNTNGQKISKNNGIALDSDTESGQKCKMKAKSKRLSPSGSDNSGDAGCSQQKRQAPETVDSPCGTVKEKFQRNRLQPADTPPPPQHQSKLTNTQSKEVMQDACLESDIIFVSDTEDENDPIRNQEDIEKSGQLVEAKCDSEYVQHNRQKISEKESDIIILSDTEDENDQNEKEEENEKSGQLVEAKCGSEHVQHKTNRQKRKEEERRNVKGICSSGSQDSGDALPAPKNIHSTETVDRLSGTATKRLKNPRVSSDDQLQCVGLEVDSASGPNPVVPRPLFHTSSHPKEIVKDTEVPMRVNDETQAPESLTGTGRNTDSRDKNIPHLHSDKKRLKLKPEFANDRFNFTKDSFAKSRLVSRQLSLPSNGAPSTSNCSLSSTSGRSSETISRQHSLPSNGAPSTSNCSLSSTSGRSSETISRQHSLPNHGAPSTSKCSLSSTSGQFSEARQSSACSNGLSQSGRAPTSCGQCISIPRHWSSPKPPLPRSYNHLSTLDRSCTPPKRPSFSATREKVTNDWRNPILLTRRDRKNSLGMERGLRTTNYDSRSETRSGPRTMSDDSGSEVRPEPRTTNNSWNGARQGPRTTNNSWNGARPGPRTTNNSQNEARPGPSCRHRAPRQRHESTTPLMKRAKIDAIELTKATHRDVSGKQRSSVGDHYKWSEKPTTSKPSKGFGR